MEKKSLFCQKLSFTFGKSLNSRKSRRLEVVSSCALEIQVYKKITSKYRPRYFCPKRFLQLKYNFIFNYQQINYIRNMIFDVLCRKLHLLVWQKPRFFIITFSATNCGQCLALKKANKNLTKFLSDERPRHEIQFHSASAVLKIRLLERFKARKRYVRLKTLFNFLFMKNGEGAVYRSFYEIKNCHTENCRSSNESSTIGCWKTWTIASIEFIYI